MTLREEIATLRDMIKRSGGMPLDVLRCNAPGKVMVVMRNNRPARRLISVAAIRRAEVDGVVHVSRVRKTVGKQPVGDNLIYLDDPTER